VKTKRQLQKESTKAKIIATAYQIYSEYGFSATTARIAKAAGVSHGTIFVHFPTVDELLIDVIESFSSKLAIEMHDLADREDSAENLLCTYLDILSRYENFYIHLISEKRLLPEDVGLVLVNMQSTIAFHFNRVIKREINSRTVKNIPVHMIFNTWMGMIHYYLMNKDLFSPNAPLLKRYSEELINTFLELIKNNQEVSQ